MKQKEIIKQPWLAMSEPGEKKKGFLSIINRVRVHFPFQPYQSQMMMMERIIKALNKPKEHALLESPTGTGKTLALLCSVLSWKKNMMQQTKVIKKKDSTILKEKSIDVSEPICDIIGSETEEDLNSEEETEKPKIYFATRTHRQIKQVVGELKESGYKIPMAVLGSRKHMCINGDANKKKNLEEACSDLQKNKNCRFVFNRSHVVDCIKETITHDIEDLVRAGKKKKGCAYYAARDLAQEAEIIFLPYNYILAKEIRKALKISLYNSIVIFDEAHNIEDACREAGSFNTSTREIGIVLQELNGLGKSEQLKDIQTEIKAIVNLLKGLFEWIQQNTMKDLNEESTITGEKLNQFLDSLGITNETLDDHQASLSSIYENQEQEKEQEKEKEKDEKKGLSKSSCGVLDKFFTVLRLILSNNRKVLGVETFCLIVERKRITESLYKETNIITFALHCLFPAVVFEEISKKARNIILTSGTLSPLETFSSELGVSFKTILEAPHVIKKEQIHTTIISKGPNQTEINGVYKNAMTEEYQKDVAEAIYKISSVVPFGVLCFFPSYGAMKRILDVMKKTNIYDRLLNRKDIFVEPHGGKIEVFNRIIKNYYISIQNGKKSFVQSNDMTQKNGALLFAVYRGKISEGLDFIDDNARCVICVGIPYPHFKSGQVNSKIEFNTKHKANLGLMHGRSWYEAQAYKALNQALGRCIRHSEDWGAIVLLESRFKAGNAIQKISKWANKTVTTEADFDQSISKLSCFIKKSLAERKTRALKPQAPCVLSDDEIEEDNQKENSWLSRSKKKFKQSKFHSFQ